ncbi:MAG: NADH-quinone oxidoreductase subunit L [Candidatus Hydrogenedentota bacterium]
MECLSHPALVLLFPLTGILWNTFFGFKFKKYAGYIASGMIFLSFLISTILFFHHSQSNVVWTKDLYTWIRVGNLDISISFLIDPLSIVMLLVVTSVSLVVHIYSIGYMKEDEGFVRFFIYLNLFVLSMLLLVSANNFLMMFIGWECVGLCSYLLIGFWYKERAPVFAGKKAFIVNRIGDFGFLCGIILIFLNFGVLDFITVSQHVNNINPVIITVICFLLFLGCIGKSAQIPLYIWLPDAMEGPTPVSALIHAATMVTAGVYLVARCNFLFGLSPCAMNLVAITGVLTAFFSATIAITNTDMKRILAYSTISQLGYMFFACGIGAYSAGIFHLATHAFFKGLLFLAAGSVMHSLSGELNIFKMGNLSKYTPYTFWTFIIAGLAISGFPGLSGFFSKDKILISAFSSGKYLLWLSGLFTAYITAFYIFRMIMLIFFTTERFDREKRQHTHESPYIMTIPLIILALLSIIAGYIPIPEYLSRVLPEPSFVLPSSTKHLLELLSVVVCLAGIVTAFLIYQKNIISSSRIKQKFLKLYTLLFNKYYVDEFYDELIVKPVNRFSLEFKNKIDDLLIDGLFVNGSGLVIKLTGLLTNLMQTGYIRHYVLFILAGMIIILVIIL